MTPMLALRLAMGEVLAADVATLAAATANKIALVKEPFVEDENLVIGDLTLADFTGSSPLSIGTGAQPCGVDPLTSDQIITLKEPAGGLRWESTDAVNLPQTIYGYALTDNAGAVLLAVKQLDTPVQLTAAGQIVVIGTADFRIVTAPMS